MIIKILAFGVARDVLGQRENLVEVPDVCDTEVLSALLEERYPSLKGLLSYSISVNRTYVEGATPISATDEVAIIPPVSGG